MEVILSMMINTQASVMDSFSRSVCYVHEKCRHNENGNTITTQNSYRGPNWA